MSEDSIELTPWVQWPDMHDERESHSSMTFDHQVFVFFGHDGEQFLSTVEILDLAQRQGPYRRKANTSWDIIGSELIEPRLETIVSQIDSDRIMILGGVVEG